jgi:plastocyanin
VSRLALLLCLAAALAAPAVAAGAAGPRGTAVGVGEREWRISPYRSRVPAGVVRFNARNLGEDGHDLAVRGRGGRVLGAVPEIRPGANRTLRLRLRPGRYTLFCTLAGHEARGMRARIVVKRRR